MRSGPDLPAVHCGNRGLRNCLRVIIDVMLWVRPPKRIQCSSICRRGEHPLRC